MPAATSGRQICAGRMRGLRVPRVIPAKHRSTGSGSATNIKFTRVRALAAERRAQPFRGVPLGVKGRPEYFGTAGAVPVRC
jgi:hypothetical protein